MAGAGDDGRPASSSNNMDPLMSGGSSSTVGAIDDCGTPLDNTAGTGDTDMSLQAVEFEAHALAPQPQVQEGNVVTRERGPERTQVAAVVEFDALITLQPPVQEGNVVTRERGLERMQVATVAPAAATAAAVEFYALITPQPPVQEGNVVTRERGPERMQVATVVPAAAAVEFDALITPQPPVQEGNVVTRKWGASRMKLVTGVEPVAAVEFNALIMPQPSVQEGNVVTRKRGAKRMKLVAGVEPAAAGSKRQRTRRGSKDTTGGEDHDEQVLEEVAGNGGDAPRRPWTKEHDQSWWNKVSSSLLSVQEFKRLFRMSPSTFEMVCQELGTTVAKNDTALRQVVPVHKRVAVCIWRLATGESLRRVAKRFGIGISTCQKIVIEICAAIKALLMPKFLLWPNGAPAATAIAAEFEATHGIPNIIGAVYNTHISITSPKSDAIVYYNPGHTRRQKKPSYSVTVQAVVDAAGSFTDISVGHPGSMSDEQVLLRSSLGVERGETGLLQAERKWLVGGASYPVKDWMLAPYVDENLTVVQKMFNAKVATMRKVAMDAAMRFKARWSLLRMRNEINVEDFPIILSACCVLHNICERQGDTLDPELAFDLVDDEMLAKRPVHSEAASLLRDSIANFLFLHGVVGDVMPYISS